MFQYIKGIVVFKWQCFWNAAKQSINIANGWGWVVGLPLGVYVGWYELGFKPMNSYESAINNVVTFLASFGAVGLVAFGIQLFKAPYDLYKEQKQLVEQLQGTKDIKTKLAKFLYQCEDFKERCKNTALPPPSQEFEEWVQTLANFISATPRLGEAYVYQLTSSAGITVAYPVGMSSQEHMSLYGTIRTVQIRLNEFLKELR